MTLLSKPYEEDKCYFYLEESVVDCEDMADHQYWKAQTDDLCAYLGLSPEEILSMIPTLLNARRTIDALTQKYPNAAGFVRLVLFDEMP